MSKETASQDKPSGHEQSVGEATPRRARRRIDPTGETLASQRLRPSSEPYPTPKPAEKPTADELLTPVPIAAQLPSPVPPTSTVPTEPLQDSFEDEATARAKARDRAVVGSGALAVVLQVVLAILAPAVMLIGILRIVASPMLLWLAYHRPGFPADAYGMTTEQRMTLGSYGLDYLFNFAPPNYLGDLRFANGNPVFTAAEVGHMVDVKQVMFTTMLSGLIAAVICLVVMILLYRMRKGAIARALFAGAIWFSVALIALAVIAALGWETFFTRFHEVFFADGTWTFSMTDTLIRLYPGQFWIDAAAGIAVLTLLTMLSIMICTAPTRRRRFRNAQAQRFMAAQVTGETKDLR